MASSINQRSEDFSTPPDSASFELPPPSEQFRQPHSHIPPETFLNPDYQRGYHRRGRGGRGRGRGQSYYGPTKRQYYEQQTRGFRGNKRGRHNQECSGSLYRPSIMEDPWKHLLSEDEEGRFQERLSQKFMKKEEEPIQIETEPTEPLINSLITNDTCTIDTTNTLDSANDSNINS